MGSFIRSDVIRSVFIRSDVIRSDVIRSVIIRSVGESHNHDVAVNMSTFKIMTKDGKKIRQLALYVLTKACPVILLSANSMLVT